jgi:hypothetical protein
MSPVNRYSLSSIDCSRASISGRGQKLGGGPLDQSTDML